MLKRGSAGYTIACQEAPQRILFRALGCFGEELY
jgi:hypothetical protein